MKVSNQLLQSSNKTTRYSGIDGIRVLAAIAVILMHVKVNIDYQIDGFIAQRVIGGFGTFISLFFIISGFSMCCGYYERIKSGNISLNEFYKRRYIKILPFFALLVVIELVYSGLTLNNIMEAFADITLVFALLPSTQISIIGVGWTLGIIFAFYIFFPFFVYLIWNKKRAILVFVISILLNYACRTTFIVNDINEENNILYCICFFIAGGIIYLYKDSIINFAEKKNILCLLIAIAMLVLRFNNPVVFDVDLIILYRLLSDSSLLILAISCRGIIKRFLSNKVMSVLSSISLEIYLAHMFIFRILQKLGMTHLSSNTYVSYGITCILTIIGVIIFALVFQWIMSHINLHRKKTLEKEIA